jgi:hypothetical protein
LSGWEMAQGLEARNRKDALAIFHASKPGENSTKLPFRVTGYGGVRGALAYLEKNELNVFADNFPGSSVVRRQVEARRSYNSSDDSLEIIRGDVASGKVLSGGGELIAIWTASPGALVINSFAQEIIHLRVKVRSSTNTDDGLSVSRQSSDSQVQSIDLFRGTQNLFFTLGLNESIGFETLKQATVLEVDLRI